MFVQLTAAASAGQHSAGKPRMYNQWLETSSNVTSPVSGSRVFNISFIILVTSVLIKLHYWRLNFLSLAVSLEIQKKILTNKILCLWMMSKVG